MIWYEDEIKRLEIERAGLNFEPKTLFYGSSSVRLWNSLAEDFSGLGPVNLGFGGSTLAGCTWFFDRVMTGYQPERLVIYAGDNDLSDGRHPEELFLFFQQLTQRVQNRFGAMPCYFISLKPSIARWDLIEQFRYTNQLISAEITHHPNWHWVDIFNPMLNADGRPNSELYVADGLHLTKKGYQLWKTSLQNVLNLNHSEG